MIDKLPKLPKIPKIHKQDRKRDYVTFISNRILTGLFVVVPLFISIWLGVKFYNILTIWSLELFESYMPPFYLKIIVQFSAFIFILFILFCVGELTNHAVGRKIIEIPNMLLSKVPFLNSVHATIRQIRDAIFKSKNNLFRQVILFEYPKKDLWVIGFLTNENKEKEFELQNKTGNDLLSIFLPTTPNPTSGFLLFVPREDCIFLDMDTKAAMQLIISGGVITPDFK